MRGLDFRTNEDQEYKDWAGEVRTVQFVGRCAVCNRRAYDDGYNDPRGALGFHAASWLVASEYSMIGEDVLLCSNCSNNNAELYRRGLKIAMEQWTE